MKDAEIRIALKRKLSRHLRRDSQAILIDELSVCAGEARVDIAVVNGSFHGYEIKSERDTLYRLAGQISAYNRALEKVSVVVAECHLEDVGRMVPGWWGIVLAEAGPRAIRLRPRRRARVNPEIDALSVAQFLWRDEALRLLEDLGIDQGVRSKTAWDMLSRLAEQVPSKRMVRLVSAQIKARGEWRVGSRHRRGGGRSRPSARSLHSRSYPILSRIDQ